MSIPEEHARWLSLLEKVKEAEKRVEVARARHEQTTRRISELFDKAGECIRHRRLVEAQRYQAEINAFEPEHMAAMRAFGDALQELEAALNAANAALPQSVKGNDGDKSH